MVLGNLVAPTFSSAVCCDDSKGYLHLRWFPEAAFIFLSFPGHGLEGACQELAFCGRPLKEPSGRTGLPVILSAVALAKEETFLTFEALAKKVAAEVAKIGGRGKGGLLVQGRCIKRDETGLPGRVHVAERRIRERRSLERGSKGDGRRGRNPLRQVPEMA